MTTPPSQGDPPSSAYRSDREAALAHASSLQQRNDALETEIFGLRSENERLRAENDRLRPYAPGAPVPRRTGFVVAGAAVAVLLITALFAVLGLSRQSAPSPSNVMPTSVSSPMPPSEPVPTSAPVPNSGILVPRSAVPSNVPMPPT